MQRSDVELAGYRPGAIGAAAALHGLTYSAEWGFGPGFEATVAQGLGKFVETYDPERDLFLTAWHGGTLIGSLVIEANGLEATLRYFVVDRAARGTGLGREMLARAVSFCDERRYDPVTLSTFAGLDAARHLYEQFGFHLVHDDLPDPWGAGVKAQRFERRLPGGSHGLE